VLHVPLHLSTVTRLLVELNRSPHHRGLFSVVSKQLSSEERRRALTAHYQPYRQAVVQTIEAMMRSGGRVLHVSVHTFTPVLDGQVRAVDVGLLYDPRRALEKRLCLRWRQAIEAAAPELRVQMNQPYRGTADGLTTNLRRRWPDRLYAGVELEVNQRFVADAGHWRRLGRLLPQTLAAALRTSD
jgi:predicted N-formylglutamate amidohydrolase